MTESRPQYRTAGGTASPEAQPDSDTTALPRVEEPAGWAPPPSGSANAGAHAYGQGGYAAGSYGAPDSGGHGASSGAGPIESNNPFSGLGSKLTAAGASAVAAATSAATTAKEAVRSSVTEQPTTASRAAGAGAASATGRGRGRARSTSRQPRKARLTLSHINVYSVFKFACVLSIALFFVWLIMVGVLYGVLDVSGVLTKVNTAVGRISGTDNPKNVVTGSLVFGSAIIIGAVYMVLFIAITTIGSMVYNLCADLVGGAEVTLSERD